MAEQTPSQRPKTILLVRKPVTPSRLLEYGYFGSLVYAHLGSTVGISIPMLGAAMVAGLAGLCFMRLRSRASAVYSPITLPVACAVSFLAIQVVFHGESVMDDYNRGFVTWILALIVLQSLSLRDGFFHRFAFVVLVIGFVALPFLSFTNQGYGLERARLDASSGVSGELAGSNGLAAWFGFCVVYFMVLGFETKRNIIRLVAWALAAACLVVVGITVSRGALLGIALATVIASRHLFKRGFLPVLLLTILVGLIFVSGLFEQSAELYMQRGGEETGRLLIWPLVIGRFLDSPLIGVGVSGTDIYLPGVSHLQSPHNGFLFIGLAGGVVPLAFFVAYWWRAARGALRLTSQHAASASFYLPLLVYGFVTTSLTNDQFFSAWIVVPLCGLLTAAAERRLPRVRNQEATVQARAPDRTRYVGVTQRR